LAIIVTPSIQGCAFLRMAAPPVFVISLADRVVHDVGIATRPDEAWMLQACRGLLDESGALAAKRYLIVDRDTKYTEQFRRRVEEGGTEVIRLLPSHRT
jgi:hypothetical protein